MANHFPKLIVLSGPEEGKEFELTGQETFLIGRSDDNNIILDDTSLSRHHVTLQYQNDAWTIRDEGSRNGTFLNEAKLDPAITTPLNNLDLIRIGIYELRFATQEFTEDDIKDLPPIDKQTLFSDPSETDIASKVDTKEPTGEFSDELSKELEQPMETDHEELNKDNKQITPEDSHYTKQKTGKSLMIFTIIALFFCILGLIIFFTYEHLNSAKDEEIDTFSDEAITEEIEKTEETPDPKKEEESKTEVTPPTEEAATTVKTEKPEQKEDKPPIKEEVTVTPVFLDKEKSDKTQPMREFTVILDIKAEPLPATIYLQDERLCITPCRQNISAKANTIYTLYADYDLRELNDIYRKKVEFKVKPNTDVIEMDINAKIGTLKVLRLPRRIEFYLEGYYDYDKLKANPAKINDVVYGKPIYLPYGKYFVELREKTKIAGSESTITEIRFQREYHITDENRLIKINVSDRDLQFFPAIIKSVPPNATVYYGGEKVGTTPYNGALPLGANQLKVSKEGFFATVIDIDMRMNSVFETTVHLKTSKMGELINDAKEQIRTEQYKNVVDILINALKYGGSAREKAEVYYLLGNVYNTQKKFDQAIPYLKRAKENKDFYQKASLALVRSHHGLKQDVSALKLVVEILANIDAKTPAAIRNEANSVFKLISPVKSVVYIFTEPAGARVFINDKILEQETPVILSDLGLANYRIQIEKTGYKTYKTKQNVKIGEFVLIKAKLEPEKL